MQCCFKKIYGTPQILWVPFFRIFCKMLAQWEGCAIIESNTVAIFVAQILCCVAQLEAQHEIDAARTQIAEAPGAKTREILFTSSATESNNLVLRGIAMTYGRRRKKLLLELIPKIAMDVNEFTPNNHSAGKLDQRSILFIANQKLAKTIEKRVDYLDNPSSGVEFWIASLVWNVLFLCRVPFFFRNLVLDRSPKFI